MALGARNTLEFIMGFRQMHKAAGLELYQDKIQLAKDGLACNVLGLKRPKQPFFRPSSPTTRSTTGLNRLA